MLRIVIDSYIQGLFLGNKSSVPREIVIEVTSRCNLDCVFCFNNIYTSTRGDVDTLSTESIKEIIDSVSRSPIRQIRFSGGEPLVRKDIFSLILYAHSKGLKVWLNTNATLLDREKVRFLSRYVENVLIPLNAFGITSELNVTKRPLFKRKLRGIRLLQEASVKTVRCGTVATKHNIHNLERIHALVERLTIDSWELFRPIPTQSNRTPIDTNDVITLVEKLLTIREKTKKAYKIYNALPFCCYEPEKVKQIAHGAQSDDGHTRFVIDSRGKAKPMYYLVENIGDPLKENMLDLWNHRFMKELRYLRLVPELCRKCRYVKMCKGGSRLVSKLLTGSYRHLDYLARPDQYKRILYKNRFADKIKVFQGVRL